MRPAHTLYLLLAALACPAAAAPVYKSVDRAGRVTYSSTPPAQARQVEKLKPAPAPSQDDVRQAAERAKQSEAQAEALARQRREEEAREEEEARRREAQRPPPPVVIEQPIYAPPPYYYPPPVKPPPRPPARPPRPQPR